MKNLTTLLVTMLSSLIPARPGILLPQLPQSDHTTSAVNVRQESWHLARRPEWRVGGPDGENVFFRLTGAVLTLGGGIVAADAGANQIIALNARGVTAWKTGRRGRGPGEFEAIVGISNWRADSVAVLDAALRRISFISAEGVFGRAIEVRNVPTGTDLVGIAAADDTSLAVAAQRGRMPGDPAGTMRTALQILLVSSAGEQLSAFGPFPGDEWFASEDPAIIGFKPLGRLTRYTTSGGRLFVALGDSARIVTVDMTTGDRGEIRVQKLTERRVRREDIAREKQRRMNEAPESFRPQLARYLSSIDFPTLLPRTREMSSTDDGLILIESYPAPTDTSSTWHVVGRDGRAVAALRVGNADRIIAVADGRALVIERDDLGVESLALFRILR